MEFSYGLIAKLWTPIKDCFAMLWSALKYLTVSAKWHITVARNYKQSATAKGGIVFKRNSNADISKHPAFVCAECFRKREQQGLNEKLIGLDYFLVCPRCGHKVANRDYKHTTAF